MAEKEEIMKALEQIKMKLDDPDLKKKFEGFSKMMQFSFPDINADFIMEIENGEIKAMEEKKVENPDILVTVDSNVFIDIINKKTNPMKAYTTGKLKAKGKLTDLLKLQKLL